MKINALRIEMDTGPRLMPCRRMNVKPYDAAGNRVSKKRGTGPTTYYVRDAQGNTLATYSFDGTTTTWKEQDLYGSSRLGMWTPNLNVGTGNTSAPDDEFNKVGKKYYELSNHLDNVLATISDRRVWTAGNLTADVITAQDYYPFGMLQPGRQYTAASGSYRYGFNGKENDNDIGKGTGGEQDYGMRIYDPRVGRFMSEDPISPKYPMLTPYQFASNNPIAGVDQDGLEFMKFDKKNTGTIVFPSTQVKNDKLIGEEYARAMKSNMNVVKTESLNELAFYIRGKHVKYDNLIFTGHGTIRYSSLKLGDGKYFNDKGFPDNALSKYKTSLKEIGQYVKPNGNIILTGCFQATPPYKNLGLDINMDGVSLIKELSKITGRDVIGNQGSTYAGANEFSGNAGLSAQPLRYEWDDTKKKMAKNEYYDYERLFQGKWTIAKPNGTVSELGDVTLNKNGQIGNVGIGPSPMSEQKATGEIPATH